MIGADLMSDNVNEIGEAFAQLDAKLLALVEQLDKEQATLTQAAQTADGEISDMPIDSYVADTNLSASKPISALGMYTSRVKKG